MGHPKPENIRQRMKSQEQLLHSHYNRAVAAETELARLRAEAKEHDCGGGGSGCHNVDRMCVSCDNIRLRAECERLTTANAALLLCVNQRTRERDEARAESAACISFLRNQMEWHDFWAEGMLGEERKNATAKNRAALREFLDQTGHAKRYMAEVDAIREGRDTFRKLVSEAVSWFNLIRHRGYGDPSSMREIDNLAYQDKALDALRRAGS